MSSPKKTPSPRWVYSKLMARFGPQGWWPVKREGVKGRRGEREKDWEPKYHPGKFPRLTPEQIFEISVGAILTQNTSWTNVVRALIELHKNNLLDPARLLKTPDSRLQTLIRSSGYFTQKAKKLKIFAKFVVEEGLKPDRNKLLALWGIGPETADSILLYALNHPVFVVDAYTRRIGERLGWKLRGGEEETRRWGEKNKYEDIQYFFESQLPRSAPLYQEYHALLVELAKKHCRKNNPVCSECPLKSRCSYFSSL